MEFSQRILLFNNIAEGNFHPVQIRFSGKYCDSEEQIYIAYRLSFH